MFMRFEPVDITMKDMVERYTKSWKLESSEYTFTNLLMWGVGGRIRLAEENDTLYFLLHYGEDRYLFAPLTLNPAGDYQLALDSAAAWCRENGVDPLFKAISGPIKEAFDRCRGYALTDDRDNYDYVYTMAELRDLSGKKLHAKRNHINQFMANYGDRYEYVPVTSSMLEECVQVYQEWLSGKDPDDADDLELCAIKIAMRHMKELGVVGGGIRIDGKLSAFTLGQRIDERAAVIHIEKADGGVVGLYTVINNLFIKNEFQDMEVINREEDMGMEGLRKAKLSYNPVYLIEKFEGRPV